MSFLEVTMEVESHDAISFRPRVKASLHLGSETYSVNANKGSLSEQLVSMKEESMRLLKEFITKHNVPNDVPDELVESSSEEIVEKPHVKSKKTKLT
ncbi:CTP-dependent diacylglycerol kinase [Quillaja saponaria]|uniref:CTP-dependent diacylglycerol kinase n=1 Tax=Quillaja saponaria TaxID=32244 RepID=A0AAD7QA06_QUISA|nr:CTP-dependent diacylglycerol kinase [Quillaja saponaria]